MRFCVPWESCSYLLSSWCQACAVAAALCPLSKHRLSESQCMQAPWQRQSHLRSFCRASRDLSALVAGLLPLRALAALACASSGMRTVVVRLPETLWQARVSYHALRSRYMLD